MVGSILIGWNWEIYLNFIWFIASPSFAEFARKKKQINQNAMGASVNHMPSTGHVETPVAFHAGTGFLQFFRLFVSRPPPSIFREAHAPGPKICSFEDLSPAKYFVYFWNSKLHTTLARGPACVRTLVVTWLQVPPFGTWHCISCKQQFQIRLDVSWAAV